MAQRRTRPTELSPTPPQSATPEPTIPEPMLSTPPQETETPQEPQETTEAPTPNPPSPSLPDLIRGALSSMTGQFTAAMQTLRNNHDEHVQKMKKLHQIQLDQERRTREEMGREIESQNRQIKTMMQNNRLLQADIARMTAEDRHQQERHAALVVQYRRTELALESSRRSAEKLSSEKKTTENKNRKLVTELQERKKELMATDKMLSRATLALERSTTATITTRRASTGVLAVLAVVVALAVLWGTTTATAALASTVPLWAVVVLTAALVTLAIASGLWVYRKTHALITSPESAV